MSNKLPFFLLSFFFLSGCETLSHKLKHASTKPEANQSTAIPQYAANVDDRHRPAPKDVKTSLRGTQFAVFDYHPTLFYRVYAKPFHVTSIELAPREELVALAAGDTKRWFVGNTTYRQAAVPITVVTVKPAYSKLRTNLLITTNQRIYRLELESVSESSRARYNAAVSWNYRPAQASRAHMRQR